MRAEKFPSSVRALAKRVEQYARDEFPHMAVNKTLRFIDGNFRAQGWQGSRFQKWKKNRRNGTILVHKGHLRRNNRGETGKASFRVYNSSPYAAVHNRGFKGSVTVKAHTRRRFAARRVGTGRFTRTGTERKKTVHVVSNTTTVKQHVRNMNIDKRQFMPESAKDSPILNNSIKRQIIADLKRITR